MRKIITIALFPGILVSFANRNVFGQSSSEPVISHCGSKSAAIDVASFATGQTWVTGNLTWSDAVQVNGCNKTTFDGGSMTNYLTDCRTNPGQKGHLFSWCAVALHRDDLCPDPWRVPDLEDFRILDSVLEGTNELHAQSSALLERYLNSWGATYTGYCTPDGELYYQGREAYYWSITEEGVYHGLHLRLFEHRFIINLRRSLFKYGGLALRCVQG